jgi:hypothetical protein
MTVSFFWFALNTNLKLQHVYQEKSKIFGTYSAFGSQICNEVNHTSFTVIKIAAKRHLRIHSGLCAGHQGSNNSDRAKHQLHPPFTVTSGTVTNVAFFAAATLLGAVQGNPLKSHPAVWQPAIIRSPPW